MLVPKLKLEIFLAQEVTELEKRDNLLIVLAESLMDDLAELGFTWGFLEEDWDASAVGGDHRLLREMLL